MKMQEANSTELEAEVSEPRSLQKLLKLYSETNSYQDMTDAEIAILIEYKMQRAAQEAKEAEIEAQRQKAVAASIEEMSAANKRALEVLETALNTAPIFETVSEV